MSAPRYVEMPNGAPRSAPSRGRAPYRLWLAFSGHSNELLSNDDLISHAWDDPSNEPESIASSLKVAVYAVRAALRTMKCACHIRVETGIGYELVAVRPTCQAHHEECSRRKEQDEHADASDAARLITCCGKWRYS